MNSEQAQPEGAPQEKGAGDSKSASPANTRHSPVTPLAPLEFLQNQRRGSITDPSLHAAGAGAGLNHSLGGGANRTASPSSLRQQPPAASQAGPPDPSATLGRYFPSVSPRSDELLSCYVNP